MPHIKHLSKDKKFKKILAKQERVTLEKQKNIYLWLCSSIMSQQLSTKVAKVIHQRFLDLYKTKKPTPQQILDTPFEKLRGIGLSNAKVNYVQNVCRFFLEHKLTDARLHKMTDQEVVDILIQIKGVGKWTTEMILMFALGREDVFAVDDLGIQQAITRLYDLDPSNKKKMKERMREISAPWSPYRTYACRYLWAWKDDA